MDRHYVVERVIMFHETRMSGREKRKRYLISMCELSSWESRCSLISAVNSGGPTLALRSVDAAS
jgi:hypothetical protein